MNKKLLITFNLLGHKPMFNFVNTGTTITVMIDGAIHTFPSSYVDFEDMCDACEAMDLDTINVLIRKSQESLSFLEGRVFSKSGVMYLKTDAGDKSIDSRLYSRISELHNQTDAAPEDIEGILNLATKLYQNENVDAINDMFRFLEYNSLPITKEGNFIAYKLVRHDYKDIYTGKIDNGVGATPTMFREDCEFNREITCSSGLHFCSKDYLPHYGNMDSRIMILEINPADVISIPVDYNNAKGRACKYKVVGEIPNNQRREEAIAEVESSVVVKLGNLLTRIKSFFSGK